jgi:hypothetical protein
MHIPPQGMVRNSGPHFDQTLNQPVDGPFHFFTPNIELADHVQEVLGQDPHLQTGLEPDHSLGVQHPGKGGAPRYLELAHIRSWPKIS